MKLLTAFLALLLLSTAALTPVTSIAANNAKPVAQKEAFIERIPPAEFLDVELEGPQRFTAISDLVILRTERTRVVYALTLQRKADGRGYDWIAYYIPDKAQAEVPSIDAEFDAKVARQYLGALNYKASRWVTVVEKSHKPSDYDEAWWFYYRVNNGAIAGLINGAAMITNPDAKAFKELFLDAPEKFVRAEPEKRNEILYEIDRKSTDIIREESAK